MSNTEIQEREKNSGQHDKIEGGLAASEIAALDQMEAGLEDDDESDSIPYTNDKKPQGVGKLISYKKTATGSLLALAIAVFGIFGTLTILQGPGQLIHASQLLSRFHFADDSKFMDGRTGKLIKHIRTKKSPERRKLSYLGNIGADFFQKKLEKNGIKPKYSDSVGTKGRLQSIEIDPNTSAGRAALTELRASGAVGANGFGPGTITVNVEGANSRQLRGVVTTLTSSAGMTGVSGDMSRRLLKKRAGYISMFHPLRRAAAKGDVKFARWVRDYREKRKVALETGGERVNPDLTNNPDTSGNTPPAADAQPKTEVKGLAEQAQADYAAGKPRAEIKANFKASIGKVAGVVGAAALVCGLDKIGDSLPKLKHQNLVLPLIRTGMDRIAVGSQGQYATKATFSLDEQRAEADSMYKTAAESDDPANDPFVNTSFFSDASIQAELGQSITGIDSMAQRKPNTDKPQFFVVISSIIDKMGGGKVCGALTSTLGGYLGSAVDIGLGFASGGASGALAIGVTAAGYAGSALFMDDLIGWLVGSPINVIAQGSELGGISNYGAALAARDSSASHGGIDLSPSQFAALKEDRINSEVLAMKNKSLFERYLNIEDSQSLAARMLYENQTLASLARPSSFVSSIASKTSISSVASSVFSTLSPKARASSHYDYGFSKKGFALQEIDDPAYDNPYDIADEIEPQLAELNEKYGKPCFNITVDPSTGAIDGGKDVVRLDGQPAKCTDRNDTLLTKYRFYLADLTAARGIACYESLDEEACGELSIGNAQPTTSGSGSAQPATPPTPEQIASIGKLECPPNMTDTLQKGATTYYRLPKAPADEYSIYSRPAAQYGQKDLVCTIFTAAKSYKQIYGGRSRVDVGDLNASGHKSHKWGVAVDLDAQGQVVAADNQNGGAKYSAQATIDLGKAFVSTGMIKNIWWCGRGTSVGSLTGGDGTLEAIRAYADSIGKPVNIKCLSGHYNHFHLDINTPRGTEYTP